MQNREQLEVRGGTLNLACLTRAQQQAYSEEKDEAFLCPRLLSIPKQEETTRLFQFGLKMASVETPEKECGTLNYEEIIRIINSTVPSFLKKKGKNDQVFLAPKFKYTFLYSFIFQEFEVSTTSILMMTIAGLGFVINLVAAVFLSYKMKTNHSPFLR